MNKEIDLDENPVKNRRPWGISFFGLLAIAGLIAMPYIAGTPDGDEMPDMVRFIGRFHPVLLHLPIGVFALILIQEFMALFSKEPRKRNLFPMFFGAASAIVAVLAGFLLLHGGGYEGSDIAARHLWGGIAFACFATLTFLVQAWSIALNGTGIFFRVMLLLSAGVMGFASHDGASITHGSDYLTQYAPDQIRKVLGLKVEEKVDVAEVKTLEERVVFTDIVQPILNQRCVECHKAEKSKGKFRMDTFELLVKGGKEGDGIEPGNSTDSNIIFRAELPEDDEEHMPPEGKKDFEDHELLIVKWWIDQGADPEKKAGEMELTDEIREAIGKFVPVSNSASAGAKVEKKKGLPSGDLQQAVAKLATDFQGSLTFESQESANLVFTGVSLRKNLTDESFAKLGPVIPKMVSVDLSATGITDRSVALLTPAQDLRMIRLNETAITDASIESLLKLKNLESINLFGTKVTDAGVKKLAGLPKLKRLYLWQTAVREGVMAELRKALPELEIVTGI